MFKYKILKIEYMRLIKQQGRKYQGKDYFKFIVVLPNKIIKLLGWKGGEELKVDLKDKKIIIEKER